MKSAAVSLGEVTTPSLILDTRKLDANLGTMRSHLARHGVQLRPHLKTAKSIEVARRAMESPSGPATVSTLAEAEAFAASGVHDILYAVSIAPGKVGRALKLRKRGVDLSILVDSLDTARAIARQACGTGLPVLIEIDSDGHRMGVSDGDFALLRTIGTTLDAAGCEVRGVLAHAGSSYGAGSRGEIAAIAAQECRSAVAAATALREAGIACPVVSIGSTPTVLYGQDFTGVTEVRAGVYMFFDLVMAGIDVCRPQDIAISVLATVIGSQPDRGRLVVDAGWTALSRDRGTMHQKVDQGFGLVCDLKGNVLEDIIVTQTNQEHGVIAVRPGSSASLPALGVGDRVRVLPNHACATASCHDGYWLVEGEAPAVLGHWPRFRGW